MSQQAILERARGTAQIVNSEHRTRVRVRYAETDQMGVVYHANYLVWMEIGRVELVRSLGLEYGRLENREGLFLGVVEVNCRYLYPARYDQELEIVTRVQKFGSRLIEFRYSIECVEPARTLAEGQTRHVWLNREMRPAKLPESYLSLLRS